LRFNFIVAGHLQGGSRTAPTLYLLRALSRLWRESFLRSHPFADFLRDRQNSPAADFLESLGNTIALKSARNFRDPPPPLPEVRKILISAVIPVETGVRSIAEDLKTLDSGFRGDNRKKKRTDFSYLSFGKGGARRSHFP